MQNQGIAKRVERIYGHLTYKIIGACMSVHRGLGPGFRERCYQRALTVELTQMGLPFEREKSIALHYLDIPVGNFYLDFLVQDQIVLELKALDALTSDHLQQVISYLTATGLEVALLVNFGTASLEYKRILPPLSVQHSTAYQARHKNGRQLESQ